MRTSGAGFLDRPLFSCTLALFMHSWTLVPVIVAAVAAGACGGGGEEARETDAPEPVQQVQGEPAWFAEQAAAAGLDFVHFNGM